jgi:peptidoglycan hydrolase-like protein with peptidoglycan-binding domain
MVDTVSWTEVAGAPSHYGRDQARPLRTEGRPTSFRSTADFKRALDTCFEEMWTHSGLGEADAVISAGALVAKPGMHGQGSALDLDGIVWHATDQRRELQFYAIDFNKDPRLYCGVGAILNRHFVHTLHYLYNADHEDHYHVDTSIRPGFSTGSKSRVLFLQATLHHVHDLPLVIDGDFGSRTSAAVATALRRLDLSGSLSTPSVWREYLLDTARIAFSASVPAGGTDDPDRRDDTEPPGDIDPQEDHERAPGKQKRTPFFFVTRPRMTGRVVRRIQRAVAEAGSDPGPIDGIYGTLTKDGVVDYQRRRDLTVDGVVGPETAGSLGIRLT